MGLYAQLLIRYIRVPRLATLTRATPEEGRPTGAERGCETPGRVAAPASPGNSETDFDSLIVILCRLFRHDRAFREL